MLWSTKVYTENEQVYFASVMGSILTGWPTIVALCQTRELPQKMFNIIRREKNKHIIYWRKKSIFEITSWLRDTKYNWLIDFNGMSTCLGSFYAWRLFIFFVSLFLFFFFVQGPMEYELFFKKRVADACASEYVCARGRVCVCVS